MGTRSTARRFSLLAALSLALALVAGSLAQAESRVPLPSVTKGKGEKCVEPVADMRRYHMTYLLHQRDDTMRRGIRTEKYSLKECVECHAKRDKTGEFVSINAPGQFCQSCHRYASVRIDCFECHAAKPKPQGESQ